jgi:membrane fusion protein (multidrug efflux system)
MHSSKSLLLYCLILVLLTTACQEEDKKITTKKVYPTTQPVRIDTSYHTSYVCDIKSRKNVEIRARVSGYLERIHVDEGNKVQKGQVLFSISSQEYREEALKAKAALKSAMAEAKSAELNLQNVKLLVSKNTISKVEQEMAETRLEALRAKVEEAQAHESQALLKLSLTEIRAPFDGVIDRIPSKVGSLIEAGSLLTTISDNEEVFAYFNISEKEYLDFSMNLKEYDTKSDINLVLANDQEYVHTGKIETIEGEFDKEIGSIAFRVRFPNPDKILKNGSTGKIRLKRKIRDALVIPQKSTVEIQDKIYVYLVDEAGKIAMKSIVPKARISHLYIVEKGLKTNDKIVYEGLQEVKEGQTISPKTLSMQNIMQNLSRQ